MKAFKRIFSIFMALILLLLPLAACDTPNAGDDTTVNDETTTPEEITTGGTTPSQPTYASEKFVITRDMSAKAVLKAVEEYASLPLRDLPAMSIGYDMYYIPADYGRGEGGGGAMETSLLDILSQLDYASIWYVKKIDDHHLYIVLRFHDSKNKKTTYKYLFYEETNDRWELYGEGYEIPITGVLSYKRYESLKPGSNFGGFYSNLMYGNVQFSADPTTNFARGEAYVPLMEGLLYVSFSSEKDYNQWKTDSYPKDCFTITQVTFIPYGTQDVSYFNGQKIAITKIAGGPIFPNDVEAYY